jgi:hypothetical protein
LCETLHVPQFYDEYAKRSIVAAHYYQAIRRFREVTINLVARVSDSRIEIVIGADNDNIIRVDSWAYRCGHAPLGAGVFEKRL